MEENKNQKSKIEEIKKQKVQIDKILLRLEIILGLSAIVFFLPLMFLASFVEMQDWLRIVIIVFAFVHFLIIIFIALKFEQIAGYYQCEKCQHKHVPTYKQAFWAMHIGRTRYLKCPKCGEKSWNKKVLSDDE